MTARNMVGALTNSQRWDNGFREESTVHGAMDDEVGPELQQLYDDFAANNMTPLWTQLGDLMPMVPTPEAIPFVWRWKALYDIAQRAGKLVPVGRGGERRAIALANPGLPGTAYATPTLWAAIQWLEGNETAPEHRHSQNAFRFVVEGEGVWTVVNGDPVAMRRGDFLLTAGYNFHGHHNDTDQPMAWIDGLDIPISKYLDVGFFEFGSERVTDEASPEISRSERLWAYPGLRPLSGLDNRVSSPIAAYRWEYTDKALSEQLKLEDEGHPATVSQGHAAIRYTNPTNGGDVLPTIRAEFHRFRAGARTEATHEVGSSVWQVFEGSGSVVLGDVEHKLETGDLFVGPSWVPWSLHADTDGLDLFRFSDAPIIERLHFNRTYLPGQK
jgi:gentisate 1,2-dioxygenase